MMLQVKNFNLIVLCTILAVANSQQLMANGQFSVSSSLTVEFAENNYTDGTNELFQWNNIATITADQTPWRVLTDPEWTYLLVTRDANKNALGQVDGKNGLIILPDQWTQPADAPTFQPVGQGITYDNNHYTADQWSHMKAAGAVFLPCRGASLDGSVVDDATTLGAYWAASEYNTDKGYCILFQDGQIHDQNSADKTNYYSLRLVKDSGTPTAIDEVNNQSEDEMSIVHTFRSFSEGDKNCQLSTKVIKDGRLLILHDAHTYTPLGQEVK